MTNDITDTGPLVWQKPRMSRLELATHVTVIVCLTVIVTLMILWGGR